jgi:uncharacterized membrane protein YeaQ/YmgE (transglycosylase-associated protein family)
VFYDPLSERRCLTMSSPLINFLGAIGIGVVIGLIGGFWLRSKQPNAIWLAPVLAIGGSLVASVIALIVGDDRDYGYREPILQVALAIVGVAVVFFMSSRSSASTSTSNSAT